MRFHVQQFIRTVVIASFAAFFLKLHLTGDIAKYVNPKYDVMSQVAAGVFVFLFFIQLQRVWRKGREHVDCSSDCTHDHGHHQSFPRKLISYGIILFPLITGFALPPEVLDSTLAENKGNLLPQGQRKEMESENTYSRSADMDSNSYNEQMVHEQEALPNDNFLEDDDYKKRMKQLEELDVIDMQDDIFSSYYDAISFEPRDFVGRTIKLKGFTYREEGLRSDQLVISRFLITHCIADAGVIGFLTEFEQASSYEQDIWMEIEGTLDVTTYNGVEVPVIKAKRGRVIEEPSHPYIYPVLRKVIE